MNTIKIVAAYAVNTWTIGLFDSKITLKAYKKGRIRGLNLKENKIQRLLDQAFTRLEMVALNFGFVAIDLAVELVDQLVHSGIQISVAAFGKHVVAFHMDVAFRSLAALFFFLFFYGE
jgi:hypothetical protein